MTQKIDKKKKRKLLDNIVTISSAIQQVFMNLLNRVFKLKNSNRTIKTLFFAQKRKGGSKVKRFFLSGGGIKIHFGCEFKGGSNNEGQILGGDADWAE